MDNRHADAPVTEDTARRDAAAGPSLPPYLIRPGRDEDAVAVAGAAVAAGAAAVLGHSSSVAAFHAPRPELQHQSEAVPRGLRGWHVHVRVGVPPERGPPHRHVRGHVHVRLLLRPAAAWLLGQRRGP